MQDGKTLRAANNAARGKVITHQLDHNANPVLLANGKQSPSISRLAGYVGAKDTVEFLQANGAAVSVHTLKIK